MKFLDLAKKRHSVRSYTDQKVEDSKLKEILSAGQVAPTGANKQAYKLIIVQSREGHERIKKAANIYEAPLAIIVCGDRDGAWTRPFDGKNLSDIDSSIVTDHMMMQATDLDLGTLWVCYFEPDILRSEFSIPDNLEPLHILAIGYSAKEPLSPDRHATARKALTETVVYETF